MHCKNCNSLLGENTKFCGKCGHKVEIEQGQKNNSDHPKVSDLDQEKLMKEIKNVGDFFRIFGYIKVIFGAVVILLLATNSDALSFVPLGYSDAAFTIVIGVLWIVLGGRIANSVDKNARKYLLIIFWLLIILGIAGFLLNIVASESGSGGLVISILLAIYANKGVRKFNLIDIKN